MRVLMITQKLDPYDPLLGFTVRWAQELAARVDHLEVLTLEAPPPELLRTLPANIHTHSMGKDDGVGRLGMSRAFYQNLRQIKADVIFSHMVPRYAWMAAPLALIRRTPQVLWYTHPAASWELKLALGLVNRAVTAVPESFPLSSRKVQAVGHGIDGDFFAPDDKTLLDTPPLIVHAARLMPVKHQHVVIKALAQITNLEWQMSFVGDVPSGESREYADSLRDMVEDHRLSSRVIFAGAIPQTALRDFYRRATAAINISPAGFFDKAALESMLMGIPTLVGTSAFDPLLGDYRALCRVDPSDSPSALAARLRELLNLQSSDRTALGALLRKRTLEAHGLSRLMDRLVAIFKELQ